MRIDFEKCLSILLKNYKLFLHGVRITCLFAITGTVFGLLIGLIIGGIRAVSIEENDSSFVRFLKKAGMLGSRFYIWVLRGTPMMVQAIFFYYLLKPLLKWDSFEAGLVVISINTGAYMAEIIRSGIQSIDAGQFEACKSIGLTYLQSLIYVIMPQAIKNSFPSIGNQLIVNIKDSSMLNVLSVTELFFQTTSIAGSNYRFIETYFISALIYLFLTTVAGWALNAIERKISPEGESKKIMEYAS